MNFEAPNNSETKSELEVFTEEVKGLKDLSDNIYRKDIDKKISNIKDQMSQKSAYDDEEYYALQDKVEELESQKEKGYDGLYVSESEKKVVQNYEKISKNYEDTGVLFASYIKSLENQVAQKSAYDDEEYYNLQDKIEALRELEKTGGIYRLYDKPECAIEDKEMQQIIQKNKERNLLEKEKDNIFDSLEEAKAEYVYMYKKEKLREKVKKSLANKQEEERVEETLASQPETGFDSKIYEFDEILEGSSEQNEELKIREVGDVLTDIGASEDVAETPKDIRIEEIDDTLTSTEINFREGIDDKETNIHEIDEMLNEKHDQQEAAPQKANKVMKELAEIEESTQEQKENLSPEKQSIFKRLKESLKKEDIQKRILIFAIASSVSITIPFASIAFCGGGLLGLGAGASVPLLELVGLGAHSAAIGGPVGAVSIFKGLEKVLKWKFIPTEENKLSDREIEDIVINVKNVLEKELL
ncbi:MAG TPA: hypothetical protein PKU93_01250 [Candidatus Pacearchaeota archaeon]|nr:hypothetical protein [Candidatus Pacearchaeota archaeon]